MIEKRLKTTAILTGIFAIVSLSVMFFKAATKNILIAEATGEQLRSINNKESFELTIEKDEDLGEVLEIPLESGVSSEDITSRDVYADHEFLIYINGKDQSFYKDCTLNTGSMSVTGASCTPIGDKGYVCITIFMDEYLNTTTELGDKSVFVQFSEPDTDNLVVIDPVDDTGVAVSAFLKEELDKQDRVKAIFMRISDTERDEDKIKSFLEESGAKVYIQIGAENVSENESGVKTYYNDRFFIRKFGNLELADELERAVAQATGAEALGLFAASEDNELIKNSTIPSAYIVLGNINNEIDEKMLTTDDYLETYAKGIASGILNSFEIISPVEEDDNALQGIINGN